MKKKILSFYHKSVSLFQRHRDFFEEFLRDPDLNPDRLTASDIIREGIELHWSWKAWNKKKQEEAS